MTHLLTGKIQTNRKDIYGETALYAACAGRHYNIVTLLIQAGVDVNQRDAAGVNALYVAAFLKDKDMVNLLLNSNAKYKNEELTYHFFQPCKECRKYPLKGEVYKWGNDRFCLECGKEKENQGSKGLELITEPEWAQFLKQCKRKPKPTKNTFTS